jgi:hypothetical protein
LTYIFVQQGCFSVFEREKKVAGSEIWIIWRMRENNDFLLFSNVGNYCRGMGRGIVMKKTNVFEPCDRTSFFGSFFSTTSL